MGHYRYRTIAAIPGFLHRNLEGFHAVDGFWETGKNVHHANAHTGCR